MNRADRQSHCKQRGSQHHHSISRCIGGKNGSVSSSHALKAQPRSPWAWDIGLAPGQRVAPGDFVLRYQLAEAADPEGLAL